MGAFDIAGAGADAIKRAGFILLSSFPAHQIVIGQKLLENLIHLCRRYFIVPGYSGAFDNRHILDIQHIFGIVARDGDPFGECARWPDDFRAGGDEQLVGRKIVGVFQELGYNLR